MHYNCHSCFSLRYGTLRIDALLDEALEKGHTVMALTDINNTSAALEFVMKARKRGVRPVLGIEFRADNRLQYIGLARNVAGWQQLCEFLSEHLHNSARAAPGQSAIQQDKRKRAHVEGTSGLSLSPGSKYEGRRAKSTILEKLPTDRTPNSHSNLYSPGPGTVLPGPMRKLRFPARAPELADAFFIYPFTASPEPGTLRADEFVGLRPCELNRLFSSPWRAHPDKLLTLLPVTYRDKVGYHTHRLLRAIDRNTILSKQVPDDVAAADETMRSMEEVLQLYKGHTQLVTNTMRLLDNCSFGMTFDKHKNKQHFTGSRYDDRMLLEKLSWDGFRYRYAAKDRVARARVEKELEVIDRLGYSAYFLITWDFIRYGQSRGFFHVGRGSGANSIVAYCMGITDVDPIDLDLYFERFLNPHRTSPPDFDIDFSWTDRDDVIDYVFKRYGHTHTSLMATYNTFKGRSIIRELGKVFGLPKAEIDDLVARRHNPSLDDKVVRWIYRYGREFEGLPNHLGIHPGGILISEQPVRAYGATELPPKGFPIVQFDMFVAEDAGLYKYDVLSQRGLGHIKSSYEIVRENQGQTVDVHNVRAFKKDPKIAALLREGRTIGCFYVESPAMRQLLRKLRCDDYLTLVAASSVIRPGVAKSGMMKQYIERHRIWSGQDGRRDGQCQGITQPIETPKGIHDASWYFHPKVGNILHETYGVMVYQEDVIKVAHYFGGVGLGEADILRRAMSGKYRSRNHFDLLRERFFENCRELGYAEQMTAEVWRQMESFSGYSFCKAHSASFAVESYQSLYFKAHHPLEFMVGVINNFGGFYRTEVYLHEARLAGAVVHAPCVNHSGFLTRLEGVELWLGFVHLNGLSNKIGDLLVEEREREGEFRDMADLCRRVSLGLEQLTILIRVGGLRFTGKSKKKLLWEANMHFSKEAPRKQKTALFVQEHKEWALPDLPDDPVEDMYDEIELLGFPLPPRPPNSNSQVGESLSLSTSSEDEGAAPDEGQGVETRVMPPAFQLLAEPLHPKETRARDLVSHLGKRVAISGYLICTKQVRTVKGTMMGFSDFIDVEGRFFDATLFPDTFMKYPLTGIGVYRMIGKVADDFGVASLEVERIERLGYLGDPRRA